MTKTQAINTQAKIRDRFFSLQFKRWIARCCSRGSLHVIYIRDRSLHHLDLESDFLSLSPPVILLLSNARVDESCRPSFRAADRKLIESEKKNQNACLRVEYHHNVIVGG